MDFGFRLVGLWILIGFGLDLDWLVWVGVVGLVVGHVWSLLVLMGLLLLCSSLLIVLV